MEIKQAIKEIERVIDRLEQIEIKNATKEDYEAIDVAIDFLQWAKKKGEEA